MVFLNQLAVGSTPTTTVQSGNGPIRSSTVFNLIPHREENKQVPLVRSANDLKPLLEECGYTGARLGTDFDFGSMTIPLVGFATKPWDFDSACIAVIDGNGSSNAVVASCRDFGAPIVWVLQSGIVEWWIQHGITPTLFASTPVGEFPALVLQQKSRLHPNSVYRGKTIARVDQTRQLDFVDAGFLPLLREEAGKKLHDLVEGMTHATLKSLRQSSPSRATLRKIFTAVFRLLGGKILKDKAVHGFKGLDLSDPGDVLSAVARHYDRSQTPPRLQGEWKTAMASAASQLSDAGSFAVVSPEALAYVYEQTLVTKSLRKKLGIHATPPWLVDYMVWQLYDWIRDIPEEDRHVFEPACGHAPFLLSAMRLLRLEMQDQEETKVHNYLKRHIHGVEIDDFAREIARLSLTLADIPNPNGWDLQSGDMYASDVLARQAAECRILLSNPPYERFGDKEKRGLAAAGYPVQRRKAVELLDRILPVLPDGAVFGLVVPQGVLHNTEGQASRELLLRDFDIREICLFADKVFEEGDAETAVILGRRRSHGAPSAGSINFRRVREDGVGHFAKTYSADAEQAVSKALILKKLHGSLRLPDLWEVWDHLADAPTLETVASVGQGFTFADKGATARARQAARRKTADAVRGFLEGVKKLNIWEVPSEAWISPSRTPIGAWRSGTSFGHPQILVNRSPVTRGPWRIKALLDPLGRAVPNIYNTVRPKREGLSAVFLWAVLNSPLANAFVYCNALKRHIYDGLLSRFPLPRKWRDHVTPIVDAANAYLKLVKPREQFALETVDDTSVRETLLAMDAAVMRAYNLPVRSERAVLDLFRLPSYDKAARKRKGVGCAFGDYYPAEFKSLVPLHKYLSRSYQRSTLDRVADRIKPSDTSAAVAALRIAADAFGGDE